MNSQLNVSLVLTSYQT